MAHNRKVGHHLREQDLDDADGDAGGADCLPEAASRAYGGLLAQARNDKAGWQDGTGWKNVEVDELSERISQQDTRDANHPIHVSLASTRCASRL